MTLSDQLPPRRVGILGGMGPAATADFYAKLIEETPARSDQEHLPVVIWADPRVPDRTEFLLNDGEDPTPWLVEGLTALADAGCDVVAVPCNSAHAIVPDLARDAGLELVSIIEATADELESQGESVVGVLATTGTLRARLYADALDRRGITTVEPGPEEQRIVMDSIRAVKSGSITPDPARALQQVMRTLTEQGAQKIAAACTEIVLALHGEETSVPVVDPARILAQRIVAAATETR